MMAQSALAMAWDSMNPMAMTMAAGDPATESACHDAVTIVVDDRMIAVDDRMAMQHHIPPIDQHRRRDPCRRCRRVREADSRGEVARAFIDGCTYSGLRPRMMRTNTTTTAITSRMWMKPPKVCADTMPNSQRINSSMAMVSSNIVSATRYCSGLA
jgi:hypothetical protein